MKKMKTKLRPISIITKKISNTSLSLSVFIYKHFWAGIVLKMKKENKNKKKTKVISVKEYLRQMLCN